MTVNELPTALVDDMRAKSIDIDETLSILNAFNAGAYDNVLPLQATDIPAIDGKRVMDLVNTTTFALDRKILRQRLEVLNLQLPDDLPPGSLAERGNLLILSREALKRIGMLAYPLTAYGILNGGSATSYIDHKKNESFNKGLFSLYRNEFELFSPLYTGKPKGITPAFVNPDGTPGESFLILKLRALLIQALEYRCREGWDSGHLFSVFQMTSLHTNAQIASACAYYADHPLLRDLIRETETPITKLSTGIQPLIAAYTHSAMGRPRGIFANAFGAEHAALPLPGGHGRNFTVLKDIYRQLYRDGKRFVYLSNVDNLGSTIDPVELALLALTGKQAAFDFAFRTPVDVKGGILVTDQYGRLNCGDIGTAISLAEVQRIEAAGTPILFNCATGLFDLEYLTANLDRIAENLPMRFTDQDKDAGRYSQAEQVTWEVIGLLDDFLVFAIDKYDRFLAAKLFVENLLTSGVKCTYPGNPLNNPEAGPLREVAANLRAGLAGKLSTVYGMRLVENRWVPLSVEELRERSGFIC